MVAIASITEIMEIFQSIHQTILDGLSSGTTIINYFVRLNLFALNKDIFILLSKLSYHFQDTVGSMLSVFLPLFVQCMLLSVHGEPDGVH